MRLHNFWLTTVVTLAAPCLLTTTVHADSAPSASSQAVTLQNSINNLNSERVADNSASQLGQESDTADSVNQVIPDSSASANLDQEDNQATNSASGYENNSENDQAEADHTTTATGHFYTDPQGQVYYYGPDGNEYRSQWYENWGHRYYFNADGTRATGRGHTANTLKYEQIDNDLYAFDQNGVAYTGFLKGWGHMYYFAPTGARYTNRWYENWGHRYYFDGTGSRVTGRGRTVNTLTYRTIDGQLYAFDQNGVAYTGFLRGWGHIYYFGPDGARYTKRWYHNWGHAYYFGADGTLVTNTVKLMEGRLYQFDRNGIMFRESTPKVQTPPQVIALGDSITYGLQLPNGSDQTYRDEQNLWVTQAVKDLGWDVSKIDNQAVSGSTLYEGTDNSSRTVPSLLQILSNVDFNDYQVLLLGYGANDWGVAENETAGKITAALQTLYEQIMNQNPQLKVFVELPIESFAVPANQSGKASYEMTMDTPNVVGLTQNNIADLMKSFAQSHGWSVYDWRSDPLVTPQNEWTTLGRGHIHPVAQTQVAMGHRLASWMWRQVNPRIVLGNQLYVNGRPQTDKFYVDRQGNVYYFDQHGNMARNRFYRNWGHIYYFGSNGARYTNRWYQNWGHRYYFGADGALLTNRTAVIDGQRYSFDHQGIAKAIHR